MAFRAVFDGMWAFSCTETTVQPTLGPGTFPPSPNFKERRWIGPARSNQRAIQGTQPHPVILRKTQQTTQEDAPPAAPLRFEELDRADAPLNE
jgi:hypothetical protein